MDEVSGLGSDDVSPKDSVGVGTCEYFDESVSFIHSHSPSIGGEGGFSCFVGYFLFFELFFCVSDGCDFWLCIDDAGNGEVVDMSFLSCEGFDEGDGLFFCFVCEHGPPDAIANGVDSMT